MQVNVQLTKDRPLCAAQMKLAHAAFKEGKLGGALATLRALQPLSGQPDFRGFDWRNLYRLCASSPSEVFYRNGTLTHPA